MQGGTALLLQTAGTGVAVMSFAIAGMNWGNALTKSIQLSAFSVICLAVLAPVLKRAYGKDWVFAAPGVLLALEVRREPDVSTRGAADDKLHEAGGRVFDDAGERPADVGCLAFPAGLQLLQEHRHVPRRQGQGEGSFWHTNDKGDAVREAHGSRDHR